MSAKQPNNSNQGRKPRKRASKKAAKKAVRKQAKKTGRPTDYTKALGLEICLRLAKGDTLIKICDDEDMPSTTTVYRWREEKNEKGGFRDMYARARENQAWHLFEEMIKIADEAPRKANGAPGTGEASAKVQAEKIRIDTRKFFISKVLPKIFGDKVTQEHTGPDGGPIKQESEYKVTPEAEAMIKKIAAKRESLKGKK